MSPSREYHRPGALTEALALLQRPGLNTVPLAGGTWLVPRLRRDLPDELGASVDAVVDLADLGLSYIDVREQAGRRWLHVGATTTLAEVATSNDCRQLAGGLLAQAALREAPGNLRKTSTIGGSVVRAGAESELLLALLSLEATVALSEGVTEADLALLDVLEDPVSAIGRGLVVELRVPWPAPGVRGALARVARTPDDFPIVAAAAATDGTSARIALGGIAPLPLLLRLGHIDKLARSVAFALEGVDTPADFRGSVGYRRAMAAVIARRALQEALASDTP